MLEKEIIRFIAPLDYFDSAAVLKTGRFEALRGYRPFVVPPHADFVRFRASDAHAI